MAAPMTRFNEEVYFAAAPIVKVGREDIDSLKRLALTTARRRVRLCAHPAVEDRLHEMLIVHTKEAYVRPHKHLNKAESFHLIEGEVDVVFFAADGSIHEVVKMGGSMPEASFFYRVSGPEYHTLLIRSDFLVFHETTSGPFLREETEFAPWAPAEDDLAGQAEFVARLNASVAALPKAGSVTLT